MPVTMAGPSVDIRRRGGRELCLGIGASAALCWVGKLWRVSVLALFCRELGRRHYGAADYCGGLVGAATSVLVRPPGGSRLSRDANHGVSPSCVGRMGGSACIGSLAIYGDHARRAWTRCRRCPDRTNGRFTAADISDGGRYRIKEKI